MPKGMGVDSTLADGTKAPKRKKGKPKRKKSKSMKEDREIISFLEKGNKNDSKLAALRL